MLPDEKVGPQAATPGATDTTTATTTVVSKSNGQNGNGAACDPNNWWLPSMERYKYIPGKPWVNLPIIINARTGLSDFVRNVHLNNAAQHADCKWTDDPVVNVRLLHEWLAAQERPKSNGANRTGDERQHRRALAALATVCDQLAATPSGERNTMLYAKARWIFGFVANGWLDEQHARDQLAAACRTNGLAADDGEHSIQATLDSAWKCPDEIEDDDGLPVPEVTEVARGEIAGPDETRSRTATFIDGGTFVLDVPDEIPALVGEGQDVLWAEGESLMVAGPMGLGKTTLAWQLLRAQLSLGDGTILGLPVAPRPGVILVLAMDRPAQIARAAHRMFTEADRDVLAERVRIWKGPPPADVAKNPGMLLALAESAGAQTLYLDSIKDAAIGLSEDEVGAGYNRARQLLLANGVELAEQHHTVKRGPGGGPPTTAADIYGSAWITNGTGSIVLLTGDPGDPIIGFRHVRSPANEIGPYRLLHDQTAGTITIEHEVDLGALATACGADGLTAKEAAAARYDTDNPSRAQIEKVRRSLDQLTAAGTLVCVEGLKGGAPTSWFAS
ncbi:AAA family ATPase [Mycolicibacterium septicum]|uniref:AAA family ATPase n=1 Tax=Mycolicibacterium septicum TaxID=98668 RepID=UPI00235E83B5|nr:AAA family ATPase [Mycolicibacterium septicum]